MEHLLLCVVLLTGIALVSLDLSSMQFPIVGFRRFGLILELLYRLEGIPIRKSIQKYLPVS